MISGQYLPVPMDSSQYVVLPLTTNCIPHHPFTLPVSTQPLYTMVHNFISAPDASLQVCVV